MGSDTNKILKTVCQKGLNLHGLQASPRTEKRNKYSVCTAAG